MTTRACALLLALLAPAAGANLKVNAWQNTGGTDFEYSWPEMVLPEIQAKSNTAIVFSGGGSRSYLCSLGYMAALVEMGLEGKARYIAGISGGSWATSVINYADPSVDDATLLGAILPPENINLTVIGHMDPKCARSAPNNDLITEALEQIIKVGTGSAWKEAVQEVFLKPRGIPKDAPFSWSAATVKDIKARNPALAGTTFAVTRKNRPYMVLGISLLGPYYLSPFDKHNRAYTLLEATPLAVGEAYSRNVTFSGYGCEVCFKLKHETVPVGGWIEPIGVDMGGPDDSKPKDYSAPTVGLAPGQKQGVLTMPALHRPLSLADAVSASSWALGDAIATLLPVSALLGFRTGYWSPSPRSAAAQPDTDLPPGTGPAVQTFLLGDGGNFENPNLIGMLQRGVKKIVMFANFEHPLKPKEDWDPAARAPTDDDLDNDIPAFFGIFTEKNSSTGIFINKNQVFPTAEFVPVAQQLQAAQAKGSGVVVKTELTTVRNDWWGVKGGQKVTVLWVYLSRAPEWEARLPAEIRADVVPKKNPLDPSSTITSGPYKGFPHYSTSELKLDYGQANLVSNLCGWVLQQHKADVVSMFD